MTQTKRTTAARKKPARKSPRAGSVLAWLFGIAAAGIASGVLLAVFVFAFIYRQLPPIDTLADYRPRVPLRVWSADGKLIGDTIKVTKTGEDWNTYKVFNGGTASLTAGIHQIRLLLTGAYVNIDWFAIGDVTLPDTGITVLGSSLRLNAANHETYRVFNLNGKLLGTVSLNGNTASKALKLAGYKDGVYMLRSANGKKAFMTNSAR